MINNHDHYLPLLFNTYFEVTLYTSYFNKQFKEILSLMSIHLYYEPIHNRLLHNYFLKNIIIYTI